MRIPTRARGFTLIELVVTVAIIGVLTGAAMPLVQLTAQRERESELHQSLRILRKAIDAYKEAADAGRVRLEVGDTGYPPSLQTLVDGVEDIQSEKKVMMYFLRRLPRDPLFPDSSTGAAETWGMRSYKSPPQDPQPGDDVFDVYSLAAGKGLNGVAYHDW
jgi:general secretion pathway protein G